jgi:GGDEF domain-containing protein
MCDFDVTCIDDEALASVARQVRSGDRFGDSGRAYRAALGELFDRFHAVAPGKWIISDLITVGAPLSYPQLLLVPPGRKIKDGEWFLRTAAGDNDIALPVDRAAERGLLPITAFRYVERTHEPLLVADATREDRFSRGSYIARLDRCSLMAVPIPNSGDTRAIVILTNSLTNGAFIADRLGTLTLIAGQLAVSLSNALLYGSLEERVAHRTRALAEQTRALAEANSRLEVLSITDALTGVANRRRFAEVLASEWDRAQANGSPIGIVLMDIDHFKGYNDRHGHPAGDECLRQVAGILGSAVRGTDLLCRYGGEEFAVILHDVDDDGAACISERFRAAVAAAR